MNQDHTRDLVWWDIPRWAPTIPRILASTLAGGLAGGLLTGLAFPLLNVQSVFAYGLGGALGSMIFGLAFGFGIGLPFGLRYGRGGRAPQRVKNWRAIKMRLVLTAGLVYGLAGGLASNIALVLAYRLVDRFVALSNPTHLPVILLVYGLVIGLILGPVGWLIEGERRSPRPGKSWRNGGFFGLVLGLMGLGLTLDGYGLRGRLTVMLLFGLMGGLIGGLMGKLGGLAGGPRRRGAPSGPARELA